MMSQSEPVSMRGKKMSSYAVLLFTKTPFSRTPSVAPTSSFRRYGSTGLRKVSRRKPQPDRARVIFRNELASQKLDNSLLSPVYIPEDSNGVLKSSHPAARLLGNSGLVVQRELELGNLLLGFEQANKYVVMDPNGSHLGFIAEEESGIAKIVARQWFRTHRAFTTHVFDKDEREVLRFYRPFSFINSRIRVFDPIDPTSTSTRTTTKPSPLRIIGECHQQWHLLRRKYNLFLHHDPITTSFASQAGEQLRRGLEGHGVFTQFAYVDEPFLSWDFSLRNASGKLVGSVNRNFAGFGREIFTDTGVYALRMDSASEHQGQSPQAQTGGETNMIESAGGRAMTLDERAVILATAVTIDFDYFSRHSGHGGGFFPSFGSDYIDSGSDDILDTDGKTRPTKAPTTPPSQKPADQQDSQDRPSGGDSWGSGKGGGSDGDDSWPWDN